MKSVVQSTRASQQNPHKVTNTSAVEASSLGEAAAVQMMPDRFIKSPCLAPPNLTGIE